MQIAASAEPRLPGSASSGYSPLASARYWWDVGGNFDVYVFRTGGKLMNSSGYVAL